MLAMTMAGKVMGQTQEPQCELGITGRGPWTVESPKVCIFISNFPFLYCSELSPAHLTKQKLSAAWSKRHQTERLLWHLFITRGSMKDRQLHTYRIHDVICGESHASWASGLWVKSHGGFLDGDIVGLNLCCRTDGCLLVTGCVCVALDALTGCESLTVTRGTSQFTHFNNGTLIALISNWLYWHAGQKILTL